MSMMQMNVHEYAADDSRTTVSSRFQDASSRIKHAYKKKSVVYGTVAAVVLMLVVVLSVSLTGGKTSRSGPLSNLTTNGPRDPPAEIEPKSQQSNKNELGTFLVEYYKGLGLVWNALSDEDAPQHKALKWISGRDEFTAYEGAQRVQRFALATFYYATFMTEHDFLPTPTDWAAQDKWITDSHECSWKGVACDSSNQVVGILLPSNALSGSLPIELAMLTHLQELDLTSNFIHMEDEAHELWNHLSNLRILLMEDNFVVAETGLPDQFIGLTSLEKLVLSYNLLQGPLNGATFAAMQSLQHLEVESNYLSGGIPAEVGLLPSLIYFYARRNLLVIDLSAMLIAGSYPSLFSLWLDNNSVTGRIPTTIGGLTELASFSITNATLTGPIPTEFGSLTGLKRVWLYDNNLSGAIPAVLNNLVNLEVFEIHENALTGSMPDNICNAVAGSSYSFRALTADCDTVSCDNCCTVCYPN